MQGPQSCHSGTGVSPKPKSKPRVHLRFANLQVLSKGPLDLKLGLPETVKPNQSPKLLKLKLETTENGK